MGQTTYSIHPAAGFAGMHGDLGAEHDSIHKRNNEAGGIPFGVFVARDSADKDVGAKLVASAADQILGAVMHSNWAENQALSGAQGVLAGAMMSVLNKGSIFVITEQDVAAGDPVFARFATSADTTRTQKGAARKDADGVGQVSTLTPTAVNSTVYTLQVLVGGDLYEFTTTSDSSATAAEIVAAFQALMVANTAFTALVTASGSATLILTGVTPGSAFDVANVGPGVIAVSTVAEAATALKVPRAFFTKTATAGTAVPVELNLP